MDNEYQTVKIIDVESSGKLVNFFKIKNKAKIMPGQYYKIWVPGFGESKLAFSNYDKGTVLFMINKLDEALNTIFELKRRDEIIIRGPYGHGFPMNNFTGHDIVLITQTSLMPPISSAYDYIMENKDSYGKVSFIVQKIKPKKAFIKKINDMAEDKRVILTILEEDENLLDNAILKETDKKAYYLLSLKEADLKKTAKQLALNGISKKRIYFYINRHIDCAKGICGKCMIYGRHICVDGPVFRSDALWGVIDEKD